MSVFQEIKNIKSGKQDLKKFGMTVGIAFFILFFILFFLKKTWYNPIIIIGAILIALGFTLPKTLYPLQKIWMATSISLGWVVSHIILGILFYLLFTPIGIASKIFRKKFLSLGFRGSKKSYWTQRVDTPPKPDDYEKQY